MPDILTEPLTREAFAPFGQVLETEGANHFTINRGWCERYHDLAAIELKGNDPRPLISIFRAKARTLPYTLGLVERHPLGSQAFMPLNQKPFLVIVCPDQDGTPGTPRAFLTAPGQGINFAANTWHGVLTTLWDDGDFLVVDRGGPGNNLQEFTFPEPYLIKDNP